MSCPSGCEVNEIGRGYMLCMPLEAHIKELLARPSHELQGPYADDLEDTVQRGMAAVHSGELWIRHIGLALESSGDDSERRAALERELSESRASVGRVRAQVELLHARARELGVGAPRARAV
jgi:hypothetical protein